MIRVHKKKAGLGPLVGSYKPFRRGVQGGQVNDAKPLPAPRDYYTARVISLALPPESGPGSIDHLKSKYGYLLPNEENVAKMDRINVPKQKKKKATRPPWIRPSIPKIKTSDVIVSTRTTQHIPRPSWVTLPSCCYDKRPINKIDDSLRSSIRQIETEQRRLSMLRRRSTDAAKFNKPLNTPIYTDEAMEEYDRELENKLKRERHQSLKDERAKISVKYENQIEMLKNIHKPKKSIIKAPELPKGRNNRRSTGGYGSICSDDTNYDPTTRFSSTDGTAQQGILASGQHDQSNRLSLTWKISSASNVSAINSQTSFDRSGRSSRCSAGSMDRGTRTTGSADRGTRCSSGSMDQGPRNSLGLSVVSREDSELSFITEVTRSGNIHGPKKSVTIKTSPKVSPRSSRHKIQHQHQTGV